MEHYSNTLMDILHSIEECRFIYDSITKELCIKDPFEEITDEFIRSFSPTLNQRNDFKSRLENAIAFLFVNKESFCFDCMYCFHEKISCYSVSGKIDWEKPYLVRGKIYDITNQKSALERIVHGQKLRALGELSSGLVHDCNNQLMVIMGACDLLEISDLNAKQQKYVDTIQDSAAKCSEMAKRLLLFGKRDSEIMEAFDLRATIEDTVEILNHTIRNAATIQCIFGVNKAIIFGNENNIQNSILNIIKNAAEAVVMKKREQGVNGMIDPIIVSLVKSKIEAQPVGLITRNFVLGEYYQVIVSDHGCGISPDIMGKLFEPFFSTKSVSEGSGIGLSTVLTTVIKNHAHIAVQSTLGVGTSFNLYFPICTNNQ